MLRQVIVLLLLVAASSAGKKKNNNWNPYYQLAAGQTSASLRDQTVFGPLEELGPIKLDGAIAMKFDGNGIIIDQDGLYYVYGQVHYIHYEGKGQLYNRVRLTINGTPFRFLQQGMDGRADIGNVYSGGLAALQRGDRIAMITQTNCRINMDPKVTFFGAFRVAFSCDECRRVG